jgi:HEPN domain
LAPVRIRGFARRPDDQSGSPIAAPSGLFSLPAIGGKSLEVSFGLRNRIDFPKTHDLNLLRRLLPDDSPVKLAFSDFGSLIVFAVESRYPGDYPDASEDDANNAIDLAQRVLQIALRQSGQ